MASEICLEAALEFSHELADAARPLTTAYFRRPLTVDLKADDSPVTVADRLVEARLREMIHQRYPSHGIVGEEQGNEGGSVGLDEGWTWVIDPIDGTRSFITGMPTFATLIALLRGGHSVVGVLDMPLLNERWQGCLGRPSRHNGHLCRTSQRQELSQCSLFSTSIDMFSGMDLVRYNRLSQGVMMRRFGGDAYAYGLLASGYVDLVVEATMSPYDYLTHVPIIEGAGGVISDWQGNPLGLAGDGRVLAAANPLLHQAALALLDGACCDQ